MHIAINVIMNETFDSVQESEDLNWSAKNYYEMLMWYDRSIYIFVVVNLKER